jgi:hypothetical protein
MRLDIAFHGRLRITKLMELTSGEGSSGKIESSSGSAGQNRLTSRTASTDEFHHCQPSDEMFPTLAHNYVDPLERSFRDIQVLMPIRIW